MIGHNEKEGIHIYEYGSCPSIHYIFYIQQLFFLCKLNQFFLEYYSPTREKRRDSRTPGVQESTVEVQEKCRKVQ